MSILSTLRDRLSGRNASADSPQPSGDATAGSAEEAGLPFADYDRHDDREVVDELSDHSQVELEAVETYERSHKSRQSVLDKLRFMRQREPLPGYDALSMEEILAALKEADVPTIKKVRGYERKFANRPEVEDEALRLLHQHQADQPASAPPSYQPMSATTDSSAPVEPPEKSGGA